MIFTRIYIGQGYLPQMTGSTSTFIPVNATHVPDEHHSHVHKQIKCHHFGFVVVFWEVSVYVTCIIPEQYIYLFKFVCKVTSGPRFAREPLFLLWVFCNPKHLQCHFTTSHCNRFWIISYRGKFCLTPQCEQTQ